MDDSESSELDSKEEKVVPKHKQMKGGKQPVHKEPAKKKRKVVATPTCKHGGVKIREPATRPSGRRYVVMADSDDEDEEEMLQQRATRMAPPNPTTRASS